MARKKANDNGTEPQEIKITAEEAQAAKEAAEVEIHASEEAAEIKSQSAQEAEKVEEETREMTMDELQKALDESRSQAQEYLEGWQRERAAFDNYRRRVEQQREQTRRELLISIIKRYLEVLDDLELALKNKPTEGAGAEWAKGIELIYRKMLNILESEGIKPIPAEPGMQFDPRYHEAISHEPHDVHESEQIIEVLRRGYMIGDQVIRPALVRVAQ